jgi:hypothetical protein
MREIRQKRRGRAEVTFNDPNTIHLLQAKNTRDCIHCVQTALKVFMSIRISWNYGEKNTAHARDALRLTDISSLII